MKFITAFLLFASLVAASPVERRQTVGSSSNDYGSKCWEILFFFARGSTESGNMGSIIGPPLANDLRAAFPNGQVGVQGVVYDAALGTNYDAYGADPIGISYLEKVITGTVSSCPNTIIVVGGYSQGAALAARALSVLSTSITSHVVGAVLFGFTQNEQDGGRIPNYPTSQTKVYCALGDLVCDGTLIITAAHLSYGSDASSASSFLSGLIKKAL